MNILKSAKYIKDAVAKEFEDKKGTECLSKIKYERQVYDLAYQSFRIYNHYLWDEITSDDEEVIKENEKLAHNEFMDYYHKLEWGNYADIEANAKALIEGRATSWLPIGAEEMLQLDRRTNSRFKLDDIIEAAKQCKHILLESNDSKYAYLDLQEIMELYRCGCEEYPDEDKYIPICKQCGHLQLFYLEKCPKCGAEWRHSEWYRKPLSFKRFLFEDAVGDLAYAFFHTDEIHRGMWKDYLSNNSYSPISVAEKEKQDARDKKECQKIVDHKKEVFRELLSDFMAEWKDKKGIQDLLDKFIDFYDNDGPWTPIGCKEFLEAGEDDTLEDVKNRIHGDWETDDPEAQETMDDYLSYRVINLSNYFKFLTEENYDFEQEGAQFLPICPHCGRLRLESAVTKCPQCGMDMDILEEDEETIEESAFCSNCGTKISEDAKFCPSCGTKLKKEKYCSECGTKLSADSKFCPNCGKQVQ